ncbi:lysosomal acid glucosylceramidase-like [Pollicipes pollicipes]|uniref:lysosomal acid glucosylceramidase-like n=1 Tax=Pollicipes pollicipes TaxID=41117 RepID=UPI001885129F|nr:lysosomal acid glucosylceramidase-like [Pollicipes pollicipes]
MATLTALLWVGCLLSPAAAAAAGSGADAQPCSPLQFEGDSVVCVCNATYCDPFPSLTPAMGANATVVTSSRAGDRFVVSSAQWKPMVRPQPAALTLNLGQGDLRQRLLGFGGAFTDAAGVNINSLPEDVQAQLLHSYFAPDGLRYTIGRIPIGGCDFSTRPYTYDDVPGDDELENFALTEEDTLLKIPHLLTAHNMSGGSLRLFGSAWSAPAWMKTNNNLTGLGSLKPEYFQLWADYHMRFMKAYKEAGVSVGALTTQNEPTNGGLSPGAWNTMGWTADTQLTWVRDNLGPTLRASADFNETMVMILDDQRSLLPDWADTVLADEAAAAFVAGIAVHWYRDLDTPASVLTDTHNNHPDKFLLATEACEGSYSADKVVLGSWERAESYAVDIIDDLNNWVTGWVDWNIALDRIGGPNWVGNFVDSPIIVDAEKERFFKQPMFYVLGHFSALMPPGTVMTTFDEVRRDGVAAADVKSTIGFTPDGQTVLTMLNKADSGVDVTVAQPNRGTLDVHLPERSITSVLFATDY